MSRGVKWNGPRVIKLLYSCTGAVTNDRNASPGMAMDRDSENPYPLVIISSQGHSLGTKGHFYNGMESFHEMFVFLLD